MKIRLHELIAPVFRPIHRAVRAGTAQEVVAKGGRGSGKSSYISLELVLELPGYPDVNNHHIDAVRYAVETIWRRRGQ